MKNLFKLFVIIAIVAVIGFTFVACDDGSGGGGGGGGSAFDGTWNSADGEKVVLSNGAFTASEGNVDCFKGTYTANGSNISMTITQFIGAFITREIELDIGLSPTQWYTQQTFRTAVINYYVTTQGVTQSQAEAAYNEYVAPSMPGMYQTATGTVSGTTLNIFDNTFTKQGGTTNPGGNGTLTVTGIPSQYNGKYIAGMVPLAPSSSHIYAAQSFLTGQTYDRWNFVQISGGRATIPLWVVTMEGGFANATRYNASETASVNLYIHDGSSGEFTQGYILYNVWLNVGFSNGSATISWDAGTHTHTWGAWQSNASQHWRVCTSGDGAENGRASHSGNPCTTCGYTASTGGGGGGGGAGTLTITGIPSQYNGNYIVGISLSSSSPGILFAAQSWTGSGDDLNYVQISSGMAAIPIWIVVQDNYAAMTRYNGSESNIFHLSIKNESSGDHRYGSSLASKSWYDLRTTNGSATVTWDSGYD